jgi:hypothetical protein
MKTFPALAAICLLTTSLPGHADTFTLKDGTVLEGSISSETADSYVLEVQITKSIKDERTVAKADIAKIDREEPDLKAFEPIGKMSPIPDLLSEDDYQLKIAAVERFLKDHRASSKTKDAKAILESLKAEAAQVSAGSLKLNGKMVSPAEYQANAYELDSRVQEAKIRSLVEERQFLPALRLFSDFSRDYPTTLAHGALISLMKEVIQNQVADAKQSLLSFDERVKARQVGLERMTPDDRRVTEEAIKEETAAIEARYKSEKDAKLGWVTTSPYHKVSLEDAAKFGESELLRLSKVKTVLGVDGGKAFRELYSVVHGGGNAAAVTSALTAAKTAQVAPRYLAPLEAATKGRK